MAGRGWPSKMADVGAGLRLLCRLPAFLHDTLGPTESRAILAERLARRDADFLALVGRAVYANPASPYRRLLAHAGCEHGDLVSLVGRHGVEGALRTLLAAGVYLTNDELKGRRPVVRGTLSFHVDPTGLRNPALSFHLTQHSSGSRGAATPALLDLRSIREEAANLAAFVHAVGSATAVHAIWSVPGGTAMGLLLQLAATGMRPARWFSQVDPATPGLHPRYRWGAGILRAGSLLAVRPLPAPRHVPVEQPLPIVRWMADVLAAGCTPHLWTFASNAAVVAQAAIRAGVSLGGARVSLSGEPVTAGRLAAVRAAGATPIPRYGASETGALGHGCLAPAWPDDLHFESDRFALVQPGALGPPGLCPDTLLLTSLRPATRLVLVNASVGDQAAVAARACGCPLEALGWTIHLHGVRSQEKLTAGGMTVPNDEVLRVLEEVLPSRFGGGPTDYQLWEEEDEGGRARLRLLVHPAVGPLDLSAVAEVFLAAIGPGAGVERIMALAWRDGGLLRVERGVPERTATGKIHHLRQRRRSAAPSATEPDA
jgi:hypothetical protein